MRAITAALWIAGGLLALDAWYDAFGVKQGQALCLPPAGRVRVW